MTRLFVDRLTVIDFSYLDPERGLVGESWLVDVELGGALDHQGMVLDFGRVKRQVKQTIDERFDHRLLVPIDTPGLRFEGDGRRCRVRFVDRHGRQFDFSSPPDGISRIDGPEITPAALERAIEAALRPGLPDNVEDLRIRVYPEPIDGAFYHYSHGLKHHEGNCQRIAHGHRSRIEVFRDGERAPALEAEWAAGWCDVYIGTRTDVQAETQRDGIDYFRFGYTATQGRFELELPGACCYLIDGDTTVENLARHIADILAAAYPGHEYRVRAFEGVNKGAIAVARSP
jgi:6-pyruvoyl-tetrahydropterin synthase